MSYGPGPRQSILTVSGNNMDNNTLIATLLRNLVEATEAVNVLADEVRILRKLQRELPVFKGCERFGKRGDGYLMRLNTDSNRMAISAIKRKGPEHE